MCTINVKQLMMTACQVQLVLTQSVDQDNNFIWSCLLFCISTKQYISQFIDLKSPIETLTNLRGSQALFGQLEDLLFDIIRCELQPLQVMFKRLPNDQIGSEYLIQSLRDSNTIIVHILYD